MNIFRLHENVISDYRSYINSFLDIRDERIREMVERKLNDGHLWPQPLVQFNPAYEESAQIDQLIDQGILHPEIANVFTGYRLYQHQVEAIELGAKGRNFVVTSGTGSGKSLTYLATIFNRVLQEKIEHGITAIIVYPMNALIESQVKEIDKYKERFEKSTGRPFPIRYGQYTGRVEDDERSRIIEEKPHILLTNYMMMELIMTRQRESMLRRTFQENLRYLIYDELHTYRGRQGADVGMLNRRIRESARHELICIGTSATMASGHGTFAEQKQQVAHAAGHIFGKEFQPDQIVDEKLGRQFQGDKIDSERLRAAVNRVIDSGAPEEELLVHPIAVWLERGIGLEEREGRLVRRKPLMIAEITRCLAEATGIDDERCRSALENVLNWVEAVNISRVGRDAKPLLPFKLHQFIKQTGSVYVTLQDRDSREITLDAGSFIKKDASAPEMPIFPTVFSRVSGHDFICVRRDDNIGRLYPREFFDLERAVDDDDNDVGGGGYVILDIDGETLWSDDYLQALPDRWLNRRKDGSVSLKKDSQELVPRRIYFDADGSFSEEPGDLPYSGWYMDAPILFDPTAAIFYDRRTKEFTKLSQLGSEARSTATSVLSRTVIRQLGDAGIDHRAQKILSFTDNRQDASLQAGHFNDFVRVIHVRSAIYHALEEAPNSSLEIAELAQAVFAQMGLSENDYAQNPLEQARFRVANNDNEQALKQLIYYRALHDLRRGWRVVLPNLEQCGLLSIRYKGLSEIAASDEGWRDIPGFETMTPERREFILQQILDYFRRSYALAHYDLDGDRLERNGNIIRERLKHPWALDEGERLQTPYYLRIKPYQGRQHYTSSIGYMSQLGRYLREQEELRDILTNREKYDRFMNVLLAAVDSHFLISPNRPVTQDGEPVQLYRLRVDSIIWTMGNGEEVEPDPVRLRSYRGAVAPRVNEYFRDVYRAPLKGVRMLTSAEHTAQMGPDDLTKRETLFRNGDLSTLFCSPTMELGVDIADLSVVHMRNVPPNPANYAQRSGRAGRSGQAALVLTYCANQSPHDRHYFDNPRDMVAGIVAPPNIDLANQELLHAHLHAIYLAEIGLTSLDQSISQMVDLEDPENLPLRTEVADTLQLPDYKKSEIAERFRTSIMADLAPSITASWYTEGWVRNAIDRAPQAFDAALDRWRHLYRAALRQLAEAQRKLDDVTLKQTHQEKKAAEREEKQARRQRDLLRNEIGMGNGRSQSEFYPYRYFAAEGFLPGYNFTRLPVRAYLPVGDQGVFISRPRPISLREFGPYNRIYHNGAKYEVVRQQISDFDHLLTRARVSLQSGYFLKDAQYDLTHCPFTHVPIHGEGNGTVLPRLIEMTEVQARAVESISCEEEERSRRGFDVTTYFAIDTDLHDVRTLSLQSDDKELLTIKYIPAARLYFVNNGWRFYRDKEFVIERKTGFWKKSPRVTQTDEEKVTNPIEHVRLYTTDTADALYLHPSAALGLTKVGILTLQYALKKAIENVFNIEPGEIAGELMGETEQPNIMIYESAEGSLGVLSQIVDDLNRFRRVIEEAYHICYFDLDSAEERKKPRASYDDLLSYYNQRHHRDIDRHLIKGALEALMTCRPEAQGTTRESYEDHYQRILQGLDPNSALELRFLNHLFERGIRLPDQAQYLVRDLYVQPDFFYQPNVVVFVDGSVHDQQTVRDDDSRKRRALRHDGFRIIEYTYRDNLDEIVQRNADIFTTVSGVSENTL